MPRLSVVVPTHRGGAAFQRCLKRLSQVVEDDDELIVVLDGEATGARAAAEAYGGHVVQLVENKGPAVARNAGAARASGDVLVFIDADVEVHADTLSRMRQAFEADASLDALIGSYDDEPADSSIISRYRNLLHHYTHQHARKDAATFWGACGAIRRSVFLNAGCFDERFRWPSVEDIELGYRLARSGQRIALRKDILVKHLKRWSAREVLWTDVFRRAAPWTVLLLSYRTMPADLNLNWQHRLSTLAALVLVLALVLAAWETYALAVAAPATFVLLGLNLPFYSFLSRRMGRAKSLCAIPWHWAYYVCGGVGAGIGAAQFMLKSNRARNGEFESLQSVFRPLREST